MKPEDEVTIDLKEDECLIVFTRDEIIVLDYLLRDATSGLGEPLKDIFEGNNPRVVEDDFDPYKTLRDMAAKFKEAASPLHHWSRSRASDNRS